MLGEAVLGQQIERTEDVPVDERGNQYGDPRDQHPSYAEEIPRTDHFERTACPGGAPHGMRMASERAMVIAGMQPPCQNFRLHPQRVTPRWLMDSAWLTLGAG